MTKLCTKCQQVQDKTEFGLNPRYADGRINHCKKCVREASAKSYLLNKSKVLERQARKRAENPQEFKDKARIFRAENKEKLKAYGADYRKQNPEKVKASKLKYYSENLERDRELKKSYFERNKQTILESRAAWRKANPKSVLAYKHRRRTLKSQSLEHYTPKDVAQLFQLQNGLCVVCRLDLPVNYHIDHIIPLARGGDNTKYNIQLLCPCCNRQKGAKDPIVFMQSKGFLL